MSKENRAIRELAEEILEEFTNCYSKADEDILVKTIGAQEIVEEGCWEKHYDGFHDMVEIVCSRCLHTGSEHFKFCPNCGAKMAPCNK